MIMSMLNCVVINLNYITSIIKRMFRQAYKSCRSLNYTAIIKHCLYDHEMSNVSNYIKVPMGIIAALTTMIIIISRANAKRNQERDNE